MFVQSDLKQRKRQFSNRTKTGCMTCRRRKKKCDETRPGCDNCLRGGFICTGYQPRSWWPQIEQQQAAVRSQSEYESAGYAQSSYNSHHMGPQRERLHGGQTLRVDPQLEGPLGTEDDYPSASAMSSASATSSENNRLPCLEQCNPDGQLQNADERVGPLHDLSRQESSQDSEAGAPRPVQLINLPRIPHLHSNNPHFNPQVNPQVAAQLALSTLASTNRRHTQKEEMLAGRHYFPFDEELVLERERCRRACWRFNNSTNPNNGVSPEERARLFRDILQPREHVIPPTQALPVSPVGRVGDNLAIGSPFNCDYGYNINIGQDVEIGRNCTILDACEVKIGDRCNLGPNVNIYTTTLLVDSERLGSKGPNLGRKVTIDPDWITAGATTAGISHYKAFSIRIAEQAQQRNVKGWL
ncbi:trimeric LpxA-like protein [Hyaloscypha variabilis]